MTSVAARPEPAAPEPKEGNGLFIAGVFGALVLAELILSAQPKTIWVLAVVVVPVFVVRKPQYAPTVLLGAALAIEQFGYSVGPSAGAATARIPLFHGIGSYHVNAVDLLLLLMLGLCASKQASGEVAPWPKTTLAKCVYWLMAVVILGVLVGKTHGGQLRYAFTETRPYVYLAVSFVLVSVLITSRQAVRAVLWGLVVVVAFKALQGVLVFRVVRHYAVRPDAVLAHEESLFFSAFLLFVFALWLFDVPGRLRTTATALVPLVIAGDLANTRRAAWLILGVGLIALFAITAVARPSRRKIVGRVSLVLAVGLAFYLPAYWNKSGGLAQPARAIHSAIKPTPRDMSSDLYRVQEDANLQLNIRQAGPLGKGFGVPIDYVLPIQDISSIDPLIKYIPHNGVLYILMRMGILGGIAFWSLLGAALISACRLAKMRDRELAVVGATTAAVVIAYAFEGYTDQGFFYYRVAIVIGTLLGLTEAAARLARREET